MILEPPKLPIRLDRYLVETLGVSRARLVPWMKQDSVYVNGQSAKPSLIVKSIDHIELRSEPPSAVRRTPSIVPRPMIIDMMYEDTDLIVVNKACGCVVHPGETTHEPTLIDGLIHYWGQNWFPDDTCRPGIVHRLDKETDGLMVVAKSADAYADLVHQFKERTVEKRYYAMVHGRPKLDAFTIDSPLKKVRTTRYKMAVSYTDDAAKEACTHCEVIARDTSTSLIRVRPITGRTHQIRVHLAHQGWPIIGDGLYGRPRQSTDGHLLQAYHLAFNHPRTGHRLAFTINLSNRF